MRPSHVFAANQPFLRSGCIPSLPCVGSLSLGLDGRHNLTMNEAKSIWALIGAGALLLTACLTLLRGPSVPDHRGKPINVLYRDLCSGVYGGTPKASSFADAYAAFAEIESNAVPYLTQQLVYDRYGVRQMVINYLRQHEVSRPLVADLIWPTERRNYAAVALRQMGSNAESAIPALLETWAHDVPEVKLNAVSALESILRGRSTDGASQTEWKELESGVVAEAARRYPRVAEKLGIVPAGVQ